MTLLYRHLENYKALEVQEDSTRRHGRRFTIVHRAWASCIKSWNRNPRLKWYAGAMIAEENEYNINRFIEPVT